jgi:hypothetical protein
MQITGQVTAISVNLRDGANGNKLEGAVAIAGTPLQVLTDFGDGWPLVKLTINGAPTMGFINARYITVDSTGPTPFPEVGWPQQDIDSPDYSHLANSQLLPLDGGGVIEAEFELTPADLDLVIDANRFLPAGAEEIIAIGLRGACLGEPGDTPRVWQSELKNSTVVSDQRPNHRDFRCLIGFYFRNADPAKQFVSLYTASTVPNPLGVTAYFRREKGLPPPNDNCNLLPTGCYNFFVGPHTGHSGVTVSHALILSDWRDPSRNIHGTPTVLRSKNDMVYKTDDMWDQTTSPPEDHVHCSFGLATNPTWGAPFSSEGCLTVRGFDGHLPASDQWKNFKQTLIERIQMSGRCDMVLVTGRDLAVAAALRIAAAAGKIDSASLRRELVRLRPGSQGDEVKRLRAKLGLPAEPGYFDPVTKRKLTEEQVKRGVPADGIYTPALDAAWGLNVFDPLTA